MNTMVLLTYMQLMRIGVQLGHEKRQTKFLSTWIFGGWSGNMFLMNLTKTMYMFKAAIRMVQMSSKYSRPVWFVNMHPYFGGMVASYGYVCGESFSVYWWMGGSVSNFSYVLGWHALLVRLLNTDKYHLRHMDKKKLSGFMGLLAHSSRVPGAGFMPNVIESMTAVDEFMVHKVPNIGMMDSNIAATQIMFPMPGNDDSLVCMNFYCYLMAQAVLSGKVLNMHRHWVHELLNLEYKTENLKKLLLCYIFEVGVEKKKDILDNYMNFFTEEVELFESVDIKEKIIQNSLLTDVYSFTKEKFDDYLYPNLKLETFDEK